MPRPAAKPGCELAHAGEGACDGGAVERREFWAINRLTNLPFHTAGMLCALHHDVARSNLSDRERALVAELERSRT